MPTQEVIDALELRLAERIQAMYDEITIRLTNLERVLMVREVVFPNDPAAKELAKQILSGSKPASIEDASMYRSYPQEERKDIADLKRWLKEAQDSVKDKDKLLLELNERYNVLHERWTVAFNQNEKYHHQVNELCTSHNAAEIARTRLQQKLVQYERLHELCLVMRRFISFTGPDGREMTTTMNTEHSKAIREICTLLDSRLSEPSR